MKSVTLFLVVQMLSVSNEWTIAVGPLPSLQRDNILSLVYSLKTIFSIFMFRALIQSPFIPHVQVWSVPQGRSCRS